MSSSSSVANTNIISGGIDKEDVMLDIIESYHDDAAAEEAEHSQASTLMLSTPPSTNSSTNSGTAYPDVKMSVEIRSVSGIDISSGEFDAILIIRFWWEQPSSSSSADDGGGTTTTPTWIPKISFDNETEPVDRVIDRCHHNGTHWRRDIKVHGRFKGSFRMRHFPFDIQRLEFVWRPVDAYRFDQVCADISEHLELVEYDVETTAEVHGNGDRSVMAVTTHVRRKFAYYMWNDIFPLFLLGTISLASFYIPMPDLEKRLGLCVTLLLSILVMTLAHANQTKVPYLTVLHSYYLSCLAWIFSIGVCNLLVSEGDFPNPGRINYIFRLSFSIVWFSFHFIMLGYFWLWNSLKWPSPYQLINHKKIRREFRNSKKPSAAAATTALAIATIGSSSSSSNGGGNLKSKDGIDANRDCGGTTTPVSKMHSQLFSLATPAAKPAPPAAPALPPSGDNDDVGFNASTTSTCRKITPLALKLKIHSIGGSKPPPAVGKSHLWH